MAKKIVRSPRAALEENVFLPKFCSLPSLFILLVGAEIMAITLILATGDVLWESWDELGLLSLFVQWVAFFCAGALCLVRYQLARLPLIWGVVAAWLMIEIITGGIAVLAQTLLLKTHYPWGSTPETISEFAFRSMMISGLLALFALRYAYVQQQWKRRIELESQARVEALQSRIRPHFLFNSMNIIASLIQSKPQLAEQAVEDLSEIFRATLRDNGSMVPLSEEWILCRNYLRIEGLRLGDRLQVEADFSSVPQDAAIPMLTLQPLIENAIYHGIQALEKGGTIHISGMMDGDMISLRLANPVPSSSQPPTHSGNRIAVANIRHRLNLLFGSPAKLKIDVTTTEYVVTLEFPYIKSGM